MKVGDRYIWCDYVIDNEWKFLELLIISKDWGLFFGNSETSLELLEYWEYEFSVENWKKVV